MSRPLVGSFPNRQRAVQLDLLKAPMSDGNNIFPGGAFQGDDDSSALMGEISVSMYSVKFETEGLTLNFPTQGLEFDLDQSGERVLMSHENYPGWKVYSIDPAILQHPSLQRHDLKEKLAALHQQHTGPSRHTIIVYSALVGIVLGFFCLWAFSNAILGAIASAMPAEWEQQIGDASFAQLSSVVTMSKEAALTNRLFLVTERLKKGFPENPPKFEYYVGDDPMVNAFALPGGKVVVMRGLLEEATPDEMAGVLAHEVSHVIQKHGMRQLAQLVGPMLIVEYLFNQSGAVAALVAMSAMFSTLEYSRANETEADNKAWDIMVKANIDPRSLTTFFRKLRKTEGKRSGRPDIFSTHPATSDRIKTLEERWQQTSRKTGYAPVNGGPDLKPADAKGAN
jgi:Zn-dependent protease with chaperone function